MANEKLKTITLDTTSMDTGGGLEHLLDGEADGSLRSNVSPQEDSNYSLGTGSVALGAFSRASGRYALAVGGTASGNYSHSLGGTASGDYSNTLGSGEASGECSFASGLSAKATGNYSFAQGQYIEANGETSFAEGGGPSVNLASKANGDFSHVQNHATIANGYAQTVIGKYNVAQGTNSPSVQPTDHAFIIGNGANAGGAAARSNAMYVTWGGDMWLAGGIILKSPNGTEYKLGVDNNGQLTITAV